MKCPKCQHENPEEMNFCGKCATPLTDNAPDDRFSLISDYTPPELKEKIIQAGRKIESERRFVTVLFADVSGFTSLSENLDPEIVTMVMNDLFNGLISIIIKYEGLIIDFFGDGILAVFGAPLAHENDPERAIRSALEMMPYVDRFNKVSPHKLPAPLGMHIGIHSGLVVVGNVGNDLRMRYSAVGDTVNLCSRIADHATSGKIYISENTYKLLPGQLNTEHSESINVKGKKRPVTIYKLQSIKDEAVSESAGEGKGFVGRREEKEIISRALSNVLEKKEQRLLVCGEPGVGKTTLKNELVKISTPGGFSVFEGKCSSFETKTPYYLWYTLLKDILRIPGNATETEIRNQLHDTLSILKMNAEEPYLATLLSLRYEEILLEDDKERRNRIFEAVYKLIDKFSRRQPSVFILEDLHWADRFSRELLEFLMNKDEFPPSLFYIIFRPEYTDYRNIMNRGHLINLDRLSEEDILELIKLRINAGSVPDELMELIKKRTDGNPFFIEESLKTLLENELILVKKGEVELLSENLGSGVPDTVQGVVMARIDRLEGRIRDVLLNASVIGREFSKKLIEKIIDGRDDVLSHLGHLKGLELILEREEVKEFEYIFKHYMIQEVAYNTILINKRKKLHGLIAGAIEEIYRDRLKEFYELLAFHYEKAEKWEKAAEYYGRAGRKVREIYSEEESKDLFDRKNYAIEKIYETVPVKNKYRKFFIGLFGVFYVLFFGFGMVSLINIMIRITLFPVEYGIDELTSFWGLFSYSFWLAMTLSVIWIFFSCLFWGVIPLLNKIKLFELMSDRLEIIKSNNEKYIISFSEIKLIKIFKRPKRSILKTKYKEIGHQHTMKNYKLISRFKLWWKDLSKMFYQIGLEYVNDKKGIIHISRKSGRNWLNFIFPWLHSLERSNHLFLSVPEPEEFFDQLFVAFEKWKKSGVKNLNKS
ncbi:adenylate/guanylate cyclase domain-containing protein [Thermodesulfobacteriota bacterium]